MWWGAGETGAGNARGLGRQKERRRRRSALRGAKGERKFQMRKTSTEQAMGQTGIRGCVEACKEIGLLITREMSSEDQNAAIISGQEKSRHIRLNDGYFLLCSLTQTFIHDWKGKKLQNKALQLYNRVIVTHTQKKTSL